jgi:uncharacterized membrane protein (DUF4010 family)
MVAPETLDVAVRFAVAALGGLAVGIEREWSVKRGRHTPHFAGIRTFLLLGLVGALGAELVRAGPGAAGAMLFVAGSLLIVVAYAITSRGGDVGGTTEVAALIVLAGGALAGMGRLTLASALFAITTLILVQKSLFHTFVARIRSHELLAAVRFAVLALVIFPLLPRGPFGPPPGVRPQELWALVLVFSGLSFVSFVALRVVGLNRGYGLVGLLGGLVSSTAVTLNFSRESRQSLHLGRVLGIGVIAACAVLPLRVLLLIAALNASVGAEAARYLLPPFAAGLAAAALAWRRNDPKTIKAPTPRNPLRLGAAMQMALAFQVVLSIMGWVIARFGSSGILTSAAVLGLTDVDALTYSMVKLGGGAALSSTAAKALAVGVLSNTVFKVGIVLTVGRGSFRSAAASGLLVVGLGGLLALLFL